MRHLALLFAVLSLLAPVAAGAAPAAAPSATGASPGIGSAAMQTDSFDDPRVNFTITLRANGNARWTVTARFALEGADERAAFRQYGSAYEAGETDGGPSVEPFLNAAAAAENATGRTMLVRNVTRSADVLNGTVGVLRLSFVWTNFLAPGSGERLVLGDALLTPHNGTWFRSLGPDQRLVIEPPPGYFPISSTGYPIDNGSVVIAGPRTFEPGDLSVTYEHTGERTPQPWWSTAPAVGGVGALAVLAALAFVLYRWAAAGDDVGTPVGPPSTETPTDGGTGTSPPEGGGLDAPGGPPETVPEEDLELLSDEERVERLLEHSGGRMRQAAIVNETGWSDAKVSQLLSAMADEGRVEKLRLGRENLISLPDADDLGTEPDDAGTDGTDAGDDGE